MDYVQQWLGLVRNKDVISDEARFVGLHGQKTAQMDHRDGLHCYGLRGRIVMTANDEFCDIAGYTGYVAIFLSCISNAMNRTNVEDKINRNYR
jgi:hypothetical protein